MDSDSDVEEEMPPYAAPLRPLISPFYHQDPRANSTILQAVLSRDLVKAQELINAGHDINIVDRNSNSALHLAIRRKCNEMVQLLLKHEINVNHQNLLGVTPLLYALEQGSIDSIIIQLLEAGCNVNIPNKAGDSALHLAVINSSPEIIWLLIKYGADINAQNGRLFTPLHLASYHSYFDAVDLLLYYNADTTSRCDHGSTPFLYSVINSKDHEVSEILFHYYDTFIDDTTEDDSTFITAVLNNNPIAYKLLEAGLNRGYRSSDIGKALFSAIQANALDLFKIIITKFSKDCITESQFVSIFQCLYRSQTINTSNWLDYFYLLVEYGLENQLGNSRDLKTVLMDILKHLHCYNIGLNKRSCILWAFLSLGIYVEPDHLSECCALFGNRDELEILYHSYNPQFSDNKESPCIPVQYFDRMLSSGPRDFKLYLEMSYNISLQDLLINDTEIKLSQFYLGYMSFSSNILQMLASIEYPENLNIILQTVLALPNVPSLLELSRNASAFHIVSSYHIKCPYEFFYVVNKAHIPKAVKDMLLFRTSVYQI